MPPIQVSGEIEVTIGDRTQIGPGVQILAADHPRDAATRAMPPPATWPPAQPWWAIPPAPSTVEVATTRLNQETPHGNIRRIRTASRHHPAALSYCLAGRTPPQAPVPRGFALHAGGPPAAA
jgi:hypothetical protein